jgi:RimJ/RimL family protein N-acetyltransferase
MPVHIETNGYVLRSLRPQDATPRFTHWLNADEMLDGLNLPRLDFDAHALAAFITRFDDLHSHFIGIFDKSNGLLVGFYTLDVNTVHGVASITAGIGELEYRGQRVFWKTIDALLDHFFLYRDVDKITARVLARNRSMLFNFIDNPRFVYEAILRQECRAPDRTRLDLLVFAAFPDRPGRVGGS